MEEKIKNIKNEFNFSKAGKSSFKRISYLINRNKDNNDKLLDSKKNRKIIEDYYQKNLMSTNTDSFFGAQDIFSKNYKSNTIKSTANKKDNNASHISCSYLNKRNNDLYEKIKKINNNYESYDKFKYHLLNHNEIINNSLGKKEIVPSFMRYNPKNEYIYKKIVYSIPFTKISGRQDKSNSSKNNIKENENENKNNSMKTKINKNKFIKINVKDFGFKTTRNNSLFDKNENEKNIHGGINIKLQLPKKSLPKKYNDFMIRLSNNNYSFSNEKKENKTNNKTQNIIKFGEKTFGRVNSNIFEFKKNKISKIIQPSLKSLKKSKNTYSKSLMNINNKIKKINFNLDINKDNIVNDHNTDRILLMRNSESQQNININKNMEVSKKCVENKYYLKKLSNSTDNISKEKTIVSSSYKSFFNKDINNLKNKKINKSNYCTSKSILTSNSNNKYNKYNKNKKYKGINFEKMLSREYFDKINRIEEPIHPTVIPNYASIEPKCQMKVDYNVQKDNNKIVEFRGINGELTFDINKVYYKFNNHISPKGVKFNKMSGRLKDDNNSSLPCFMVRLTDRNSLDQFSENSYKMNNFSNGNFRKIQSSFNNKKTYNYRLKNISNIDNDYYYDGDMILKKNNFRQIGNIKGNETDHKLVRNKTWRSLLGEFYRKNYDDIY